MADKAPKQVPEKKPDDPKAPQQAPKEPPKPRPPLLSAGQIVAAASRVTYAVHKMLGKGGFGEVYLISPTEVPTRQYALKAERTSSDPAIESMMRLKVEILVFETIEKSRESTVSMAHFVHMYDKGKTATFKFYIMELIWKSLEDTAVEILKTRPSISPNTMVQIARQTLKAIDSLHLIGFLHRDIKAANYAVGLPPKDKMIYMLDFGIARPYRAKDGSVLAPRKKVETPHSPKYASISCHLYQEQARRDDLEVWIYMMIELYDKENITWKKNDDCLPMKTKLMKEPRSVYASGLLRVPVEYCEIIEVIMKMRYADPGDFVLINKILDKLVRKDKIDETEPLDWIKLATPKKRSRKKEVRKKESRVSRRHDDDERMVDDMLERKDRRGRPSGGGRRGRDDRGGRTEEEEDEDDEDRSDEEKDDLPQRRKRRSRNPERDRTYEDNNSGRDRARNSGRDDRRRRNSRRTRRPSKGPSRKSRFSRVSRVSRKKTYEDDDEEPPRFARIPEPDDRGRDDFVERVKDRSDRQSVRRKRDKEDRKKRDEERKEEEKNTPEKAKPKEPATDPKDPKDPKEPKKAAKDAAPAKKEPAESKKK